MFGTRLEALREEKGLTQQQLADILKVGQPTIAGYETKGKEPDFDKITILSDFFGVTTDYLLGATNERGAKKNPLSDEKGNLIVQRALKDTGLLDEDGNLSEQCGKVISDFIANNAEVLKKLMEKDD